MDDEEHVLDEVVHVGRAQHVPRDCNHAAAKAIEDQVLGGEVACRCRREKLQPLIPGPSFPLTHDHRRERPIMGTAADRDNSNF
jgi:hypothetical protein